MLKKSNNTGAIKNSVLQYTKRCSALSRYRHLIYLVTRKTLLLLGFYWLLFATWKVGVGCIFSGVRITHTHTHKKPMQTHIYTQAKAITRLNTYIFTWTQTQRLFLSVKHTHTQSPSLPTRALTHILSFFFFHSRTHKQTHTVHVPARAALLWDAGIINAEWLIALETDQSRERHCPWSMKRLWLTLSLHLPATFKLPERGVCHQRIGQGCAETQLLSGLSCTPVLDSARSRWSAIGNRIIQTGRLNSEPTLMWMYKRCLHAPTRPCRLGGFMYASVGWIIVTMHSIAGDEDEACSVKTFILLTA